MVDKILAVRELSRDIYLEDNRSAVDSALVARQAGSKPDMPRFYPITLDENGVPSIGTEIVSVVGVHS